MTKKSLASLDGLHCAHAIIMWFIYNEFDTWAYKVLGEGVNVRSIDKLVAIGIGNY